MIGENMNSTNLMHSSLPSKRGGISMRTINSSNSAAFIAANNGVHNVLSSLLSNDMISKTNVYIKEVKELAVTDFNNKVLDKYKISNDDEITSQKELMRRIDNTNLTKLYEIYDDRGKALLTTLSNKRADAFMTCNTSNNLGVAFGNLEFRILLKRRLNMDIVKIKGASCVLCEGQLDAKGDHGLNCQHGHGRHGTHNCLSAAVMRICEEAGYECELELNGLIGDNAKRPADVYVHNFYGDHSLALDLGVSCQFRDQGSRNRDQILTKCIQDREYVADLYFNTKMKKYAHLIDNERVNFKYKPIIFGADGGLKRDSRNVINHIIKMKAIKQNKNYEELLNHDYKRLHAVLAKNNAIAILEHYARLFYV